MLRQFIREYHWIGMATGIFGNVCFLAGSLSFVAGKADTGVIIFIVASSAMLLGRIGDAFVQYEWRVKHVGQDDEEEFRRAMGK